MSTVERSSIQIAGIDIQIERKAIKNLHVGVYPPNGRVRVAAPLHMDDEAVRLAVISRLSWVKRQVRSFQEQRRESKREMVSGESHYFLGKRYLLDVIYGSLKHEIVLKHSTIELHVQNGTTTENRYKLLQEWYRKELKKIVAELIGKWEEKIGITLKSWQIKRMRTQWGSCNIEKRNILLNLQLARVSIECIEYIIVHEMVHLLERHHNDRFNAYMDRVLPDWRTRREKFDEVYLVHEEWGY